MLQSRTRGEATKCGEQHDYVTHFENWPLRLVFNYIFHVNESKTYGGALSAVLEWLSDA